MSDFLKHTPFTADSIKKRDGGFLGLDRAMIIKAFFGGNAFVAILVLVLITFFLFREGVGFFPQYQRDMDLYRKSGQELVGILQSELDAYTDMLKTLETAQITLAEEVLEQVEGQEWDDEGAKWAEYGRLTQPFMAFVTENREAGAPLVSLVDEVRDQTVAIKEKVIVQFTNLDIVGIDLSTLMTEEESEVYLRETREAVLSRKPEIIEAHAQFRERLDAALKLAPEVESEEGRKQLAVYLEKARVFMTLIPDVEEDLANYDADRPYTLGQTIYGFMTGTRWVTNSSWQDRYGIWPLLSGSLMVTGIALSFAIPLGVFGAIYVNQIAGPREQNWIKPFVEFISAIPSVVIGFFGIVVFGHFIRLWSQAGLEAPEVPPFLKFVSLVLLACYLIWNFRWVVGLGEMKTSRQMVGTVILGFVWCLVTVGITPVLGWICDGLNNTALKIDAFPISERLNAFTAGGLLALMAIPTIFTLAEDALQNVPAAFTEASEAMGATRWQTIWRIQIPTALSGIISAILLGLGRVIGETMVVLLCAGNRIAIPNFTKGLGTVFQPVHTMTGIIAQEMGEVVPESIHYRALFCVGIILFFLSLSINYLAQVVVRRYKISQG